MNPSTILLVLEYATICACLLSMFSGVFAGHLSYKCNQKNSIYYASVFMGLAYIYMNGQYSQGTQINEQVSIMYRMYHLSGALILSSISINKIVKCLKSEQYNGIDRRQTES